MDMCEKEFLNVKPTIKKIDPKFPFERTRPVIATLIITNTAPEVPDSQIPKAGITLVISEDEEKGTRGAGILILIRPEA